MRPPENEFIGGAMPEQDSTYRAIFENTGAATIIVDERGRIVLANSRFEELTGFSRAEIEGKNIGFEFIHPADRERVMVNHHLRRKDPSAVPQRYELRAIDRKGTEKSILLTIDMIPGTKLSIGSLIDITESKRAERALAESERRFHSILETVTLVAVILDTEGNIAFCNEFLLKQTGWSLNEVIGRSWFDTFIPDELRADMRNVYRNGMHSDSRLPAHRENPILTKKKEIRIISWSNTVLRDERGSVIGATCIGEDITDKRRAEEALRRADAELRQVIASISDYVWSAETDHEGQLSLRYFSPVIEKISGYPPQLVMEDRDGWRKIIHPGDRQRFSVSVERVMSGESDREELEYRIIRRDGTVGWVRDSVVARTMENGCIRLNGVMSDITARRAMEDALRKSEEKYRSIVDMSYHPIWSTDENGMILFVNKAAERVFGFSAEEINGRNITEFFIADDVPVFLSALHLVLATGETVGSVETRVANTGGTVPVLSTTIIRNSDRSGRAAGVTGIAQDITDRKQAEEALRSNEERYHSLFEDSPVSLWEQDYTRIKTYLGSLEALGVKNFSAYFRENPDAVRHCIALIKVVDVNKATLALYRAGSKEELVNGFSKIFTAESLRIFSRVLEHVASGKLFFEAETVNTTLAGERIYLSLRWAVAPGYEQSYKKVYITITDITQSKQTEQQLRAYQERLSALSAQISHIEESERRQIAADIHDHIGQSLALSKMKLSSIRGQAASNGLAEAVDEIRGLIDESIRYTRTLTFELSLPILYELGLEAALEWLAENLNEKYGLTVSLMVHHPLDGLGVEPRFLLFKSVRELLMNVIKHARVPNAEVQLGRCGGSVFISVEDSGAGFYPAESQNPAMASGFGLFMVRERLKHAGGGMQIESGPGKGTGIVITLPVEDGAGRMTTEEEVRHAD